MFAQIMKLKGVTVDTNWQYSNMSALLPLFVNLGYLLKIIKISFCYISDYPIDFKGL